MARGQRAIRSDPKLPNPLRSRGVDDERGAVRRNAHTARPIDGIRDDASVSGLDSPDFVAGRIAEIDPVTRGDGKVMGLHPLGDHRFRTVAGKSDDPLAIVLARVQPAIGTEGDAVSTVGFLL